jgi:EAL domain-containing protein (putative c-di-GMP-specific phosphodiesterase class I)
MGEWVLRTAARQLSAWHQAGLAGLHVAVNLSGGQFEQRDLAQVVEGILAEAALAPEYLELEITESVAARDVVWTTAALLTLRGMGASISLDDFGTGQSSLSYLRHFPLSGLKIDRSFVQDIGKGSDNEAIVRVIIALAHSLKLRVVAEGVETVAQMTFLEQAGCEHLQDFLFGRAVPAPELPALAEAIAARLAAGSYDGLA